MTNYASGGLAAAEDEAFRLIARQWSAVVTTHLSDGTPIDTPINVAFLDGRAFFSTFGSALKSRELHRHAEVMLAPCTAVGMVAGPAIHATVRLLTGRDAQIGAAAIRRKHPILHGIFVPLLHRLLHQRTLVFELSPAAV